VNAVTFDFGQTLVELDHELLVQRVRGVGAELDARRARAETPAAWIAYNDAKRAGCQGEVAWRAFMSTLLGRSDVARGSSPASALAGELSEWLWHEQPRKNLWRKPIAGMTELVAELAARRVPLGIVSNSEGRLSELLSELGLRERFACVADSGVLGVEKPDARIFHWAAERLGVETREIVHVGDAWEADIRGALDVGARAVWFGPTDQRALPPRVAACSNAREVRLALARWRVIETPALGAW
jgi:HAD superfamily hydrolase (TIGR01549 family)